MQRTLEVLRLVEVRWTIVGVYEEAAKVRAEPIARFAGQIAPFALRRVQAPQAWRRCAGPGHADRGAGIAEYLES